MAKGSVNQKGREWQRLKQTVGLIPLQHGCRSEGEFGVVLEGCFLWVDWSYFPYMRDGPGTSSSFLLDCPCCRWLLANLLPSQSACIDCTSAKCQVRCRWYEWPGHRSKELHTRQLLPTHSVQYVLSKPIMYSNMPQCRTAAVRETKCTMHNCAQQQSSLQQSAAPCCVYSSSRVCLSHCSPWTRAQKEGSELWLRSMCHLIACPWSFMLPATCHNSCFNLGGLLAWGWLCAALTKCGAGKRLSVRSPLPIMSLRVCTLQRQEHLGVHRICFTLSWDICFTSYVEKQQTPWCLFRALHAYLCLVRWQMRCNLPPQPSVSPRCPRATTQSDAWFKHWKYGMKIAHAILAGKFLWTCQHCNCISHQRLWATHCQQDTELQGCLEFNAESSISMLQ